MSIADITFSNAISDRRGLWGLEPWNAIQGRQDNMPSINGVVVNPRAAATRRADWSWNRVSKGGAQTNTVPSAGLVPDGWGLMQYGLQRSVRIGAATQYARGASFVLEAGGGNNGIRNLNPSGLGREDGPENISIQPAGFF